MTKKDKQALADALAEFLKKLSAVSPDILETALEGINQEDEDEDEEEEKPRRRRAKKAVEEDEDEDEEEEKPRRRRRAKKAVEEEGDEGEEEKPRRRRSKKKTTEEDEEPTISLSKLRRVARLVSAEHGKGYMKEILEPYETGSIGSLEKEDYAAVLKDMEDSLAD